MVHHLSVRALGILVALFLVFGFGTPEVAYAQSCPAGAHSSGVIPAGTRVKVVALSSSDAYYASRGTIVGKVGRVDKMDPTGSGRDCWYGGQFTGDDGSSHYFYQAAFEVLGSGGGGGAGCPSGAYTGSSLSSGTRVKVLTVSSNDAYYSTRGTVEGKVGRVDGSWSQTGSPCWFAGQFYGDDGSSFYFYQAAVQAVSGAAEATSGNTCPSGSATSNMAEGTRVEVLGVHSDDAYYSNRSSIVGLQGVVSGDLHSNDGCWMGGGFTADNGTYYYFYKAAVRKLSGSGAVAAGTSCPSGSYTGSPPTAGTRVRVLTVSKDDAYFGTKSAIEGKVGRTDGAWSTTGSGCWYAGQFYGDDGSSFYFYQAALEVLGSGAPAAAASCPPGAATSGFAEGARVRVVGIHPDDAYHPTAASIIGAVGKVSGDLHSNDGCWMGGGFTADDGTYYYFYKAAVVGLGAGGTPTVTGERFMGPNVTRGRKFRIVALHPDDAFYDDRASIIGKSCSATDAMAAQEKGWYSGPARCTDGSEYYFFKVGVIVE